MGRSQYPRSQPDPNVRGCRRVKLSPRLTEEAFAKLKDDELRKHLRVY